MASESFGAADWWSQMVTVAYEQERGLRDKHQKSDGYAVSASKTIGVPVTRLFAAWHDPDLRSTWLPNAPLTIRKATEPRTMRMLWDDGPTRVDAYFTAKGDARSQIAIEHSKLPDADAGQSFKAYWASALTRLKNTLEGESSPPSS